MNRSPGYILLYRSLKDNWVWKDHEFLRAWIWILFKANFEKREALMSGSLVTVNRGELLTSLNTICVETGLSMRRTRTFLLNLEKSTMIRRQSGTKWTKITVCKYDDYQGSRHTKDNIPTVKGTNNRQTTDTTLINYNEFNERINIYFEDFWNLYDKKVGDKSRCKKKWASLKDAERERIIAFLPTWLAQYTDKQFQPHPHTFLNQRRWLDEIPDASIIKSKRALNGNAKPPEPSLPAGYDPNREILELNSTP